MPVDAHHCQPPLFAARSPSIRCCINQLSPSRQSISKFLHRNIAVIILTRLCIQPVASICRMPASTMEFRSGLAARQLVFGALRHWILWVFCLNGWCLETRGKSNRSVDRIPPQEFINQGLLTHILNLEIAILKKSLHTLAN